MGESRLQSALSEVRAVLATTPSPVLRRNDLIAILRSHRDEWDLPRYVNARIFLDFLVAHAGVLKHELTFPGRTETLYQVRRCSDYVVANAAKARSYLSHFSAVFLHNLTDQVPKVIYVNQEQRPHVAKTGTLSQRAIEAAFSRPQRLSVNRAALNKIEICVLNGKHSGQLGTTEMLLDNTDEVRITDIERTLIDIAVRPAYSGGVSVVMDAYRRASPVVSVNRLIAYLRKLDYAYPYVRCVGYYIEQAGTYSNDQITMAEREAERKHSDLRFYLTYGMKDPVYVPRWNLFVPKEFRGLQ